MAPPHSTLFPELSSSFAVGANPPHSPHVGFADRCVVSVCALTFPVNGDIPWVSGALPGSVHD